MTARDWLNRRQRRLSYVIIYGIVFWAVGTPIGVLLERVSIVAVAQSGFAVAFVTIFVQLFWLRCPFCGYSIGYVLNQRGDFRIDPRVRFCPYCGGALDDELPEASGNAPD
jgi:hypothetical protein